MKWSFHLICHFADDDFDCYKSNDNERNDNDNRDFHNSTMLLVLASHQKVSRGDRGGHLTGQPSAPDQLVKLCATDLTKTI